MILAAFASGFITGVISIIAVSLIIVEGYGL